MAVPSADGLESGGSRARDLIQLMRPHQWSKNAFVFVGLLFGHAWTVPSMVRDVLVVAVAFALASSAVYVINDIADRERDREHPRKRLRPVASGAVRPSTALLFAILLLGVSLGMAGAVSQAAVLILSGYFGLNLAYSLKLKQIPILDVFIIATGFMLRVLAGTSGVGIEPSTWLLLCALMLTLFLGFAKRRAEIQENHSLGVVDRRRVLEQYSEALLDNMISIAAACVVMSYALYTIDPDTSRIHGTEHLGYTVPFVIYGIFRYIFLLHHRNKGAEPSVDLVTDPHILAALIGWVGLVAWLIG